MSIANFRGNLFYFIFLDCHKSLRDSRNDDKGVDCFARIYDLPRNDDKGVDCFAQIYDLPRNDE